MTYIIIVYYIFTSDITYLRFAAIARCSIPASVEKLPTFFSDLLPNFLGVSKWKYSVRIRQLCLRTPAHRALRSSTLFDTLSCLKLSLHSPSRNAPINAYWSVNLKSARSSGSRKKVVQNILWDGVGATVMLPTKTWKRKYTIYINGIY